MVNIFSTVGGYMIYCPKVMPSAAGIQLAKEKYKIFPNPFKDELSAFALWPQDMAVHIKIYNSLGNCCFNTALQGLTNGCMLNLSELPAGIYLLEINNGKEIVHKKIEKK